MLHAVKAAVLALMALLVLPLPSPAGDSSPRSPAYMIKAAYLYNFAMFVEWPADAFATPESPIVIGIIGSDPFGWAIDRTVSDKRISTRRIVVERLQWNQYLRHCHIVFISGQDVARVAELSERLEGVSTMIVADTATPGHRSPINFIVSDNNVGFQINLEPSRQARLTISSKLLKLARVVR